MSYISSASPLQGPPLPFRHQLTPAPAIKLCTNTGFDHLQEKGFAINWSGKLTVGVNAQRNIESPLPFSQPEI